MVAYNYFHFCFSALSLYRMKPHIFHVTFLPFFQVLIELHWDPFKTIILDVKEWFLRNCIRKYDTYQW